MYPMKTIFFFQKNNLKDCRKQFSTKKSLGHPLQQNFSKPSLIPYAKRENQLILSPEIHLEQHIIALNLQNMKNKFKHIFKYRRRKRHSKSLPWDAYLDNQDHAATPLQPSFKQWHLKDEKKERKQHDKIKTIIYKLKGMKQSKHLRRKSCSCTSCGILSQKQFATIDLQGVIENHKRSKQSGLVFNSFNSMYMSALRKNRKDATLIIQSLSNEIESENKEGLIERPPTAEIIQTKKKKRNAVILSSSVFFNLRSNQTIMNEDKKMGKFISRKQITQDSSNLQSESIKKMNSLTMQMPLTPESQNTFPRFNLTSRNADKDKISIEKSKSLSHNREIGDFFQKQGSDIKIEKLYSLKSFQKPNKLRVITQKQLKNEISQLRKVKKLNMKSEIVRDESKALSPYDKNKLLVSLVELYQKKQTQNSQRLRQKTLSPTILVESPRQLEIQQSKKQISKNVNN